MSHNASPKNPRQVEEVYLAGIAALEGQKNYDEMLKLYQELLSYWMDLIREERDVAKKNELTTKVSVHMQRAEEVKRILRETKNKSNEGGMMGTIFGKKKSSDVTPTPAAAPKGDFHNYHVPKGPKPQKKVDEVDALIRDVMNPPAPRATSRAPNGSGRGGRGQGGRGNTSRATLTTETKNPESEYESQILNEMLDSSPGVSWDDIAGLSFAKDTIKEAVILPNLRPDLFVGLRTPPKGVLLYGPPGTGAMQDIE